MNYTELIEFILMAITEKLPFRLSIKKSTNVDETNLFILEGKTKCRQNIVSWQQCVLPELRSF